MNSLLVKVPTSNINFGEMFYLFKSSYKNCSNFERNNPWTSWIFINFVRFMPEKDLKRKK